jgi:hypothetical protein
MFRASLCSSSGGQFYIYSIWYRPTLCAAIQCTDQERTAAYIFKVGNVNTKTRTRKTKTRLENLLRIANRQIKVNMDKFAKNKHCQILNKDGLFYACEISKTCELTVLRIELIFSEYVIFVLL